MQAPKINGSVFLIYDVKKGQYWTNQNGKSFWMTAADAKRSRAINLIYRYRTSTKDMSASERFPVVEVDLGDATPVFVEQR